LNCAVLGAGSWGTALARLLALKTDAVYLWDVIPESAAELRELRENRRYLPGVAIPPNVVVTNDLAESVRGAELVVLAVPSHAVREVGGRLKPLLPPAATIVNVAKGIETDTLLRMSQVIEDVLGATASRLVTLSGPSHAEEVGREIPTTVVVASQSTLAAEQVQDWFMTPRFRVYTNPDLIGVELGGALKNIIALCAGISDGLGFGDNTKAALMTRGLAEMARLGVAMGANPLTFAGLAGLGDLVVTCTSPHSRNRRAGIALGQGKPLDQVLTEVGMVVEGVRTTRAAYNLARHYEVEMPITVEAYRILFEGQEPSVGVANLMLRGKTHEVEEVALHAVRDTLC
jgi:glycerol-3-phosphate dehydrogenase (NAD(P)+)